MRSIEELRLPNIFRQTWFLEGTDTASQHWLVTFQTEIPDDCTHININGNDLLFIGKISSKGYFELFDPMRIALKKPNPNFCRLNYDCPDNAYVQRPITAICMDGRVFHDINEYRANPELLRVTLDSVYQKLLPHAHRSGR